MTLRRYTAPPHSRRIYFIWRSMKRRCADKPGGMYFSRYGARGIKVCDRWLRFSNFLADMGEPPDGLTLDRIDNDGDYGPSNCRWATRREQVMNSVAPKFLTANGETLHIAEWEKRLGLSQGAIWHRIKDGWSLDRALTTRSLRP